MSEMLEGQSALITGASRGIGAATARVFARHGVRRILLHYNTHLAGVEELARELKPFDAECLLLGGDLTNPDGIARFCEAAKKLMPETDLLVNNAGALVQRAKLAESSGAIFDQVFDLNVKSVWLLSKEYAPGMATRQQGAIVNVSSIAARNGGGPGATLYAAAKAAVSCMTRGMAKELAPSGVRVNAVSPGTVDNHFHEVYSTKPMLDAMLATVPMGKLGTNEEVADSIAWLCSAGARYITGQTIEINGGMYMV
jgi:3-oxoacyl-[acyl-carrier protein] reductase